MLRVTVLELPARWGGQAAALAEVDALLERGPATDLVVLPEAAFTGYVSPRGEFDLAPFAEPIDGPTARSAAALAARQRAHLLAPMILREGDRVFNAACLFGPAGERVAVYRKRHPWLPETWASRGPSPPPVVALSGVRVTMAICFDVQFAASDAAAELEAAELLLFPSAWVDEHDTRIPLLAALARRFDVAVAAANWAPGVVRLRGQGDSCILDRRGDVLARVAPGANRADATL